MSRALERDGLIERRPDPSDARATLLYLTPQARAFQPVAETILAELDELVAQTLPWRRGFELKAALRELLELGR